MYGTSYKPSAKLKLCRKSTDLSKAPKILKHLRNIAAVANGISRKSIGAVSTVKSSKRLSVSFIDTDRSSACANNSFVFVNHGVLDNAKNGSTELFYTSETKDNAKEKHCGVPNHAPVS